MTYSTWFALGRVVLTGLVVLGVGACAPSRRQTVVLVVVDTLRADHLGTYGYARPTSPRLDARARQGVVFEHAYSTSSWTLPAFASMYTGQYPVRHGAGSIADGPAGVPDPAVGSDSEGADEVRGRQRFSGLDSAFPTLAEQLAGAGYATGAILSNPFLHPGFGMDRGFEHYDYAPRRRAAATVDLALEWLTENSGGPTFLMLHFMDPHLPYAPPSEYRGRFAEPSRSALDYPVSRVHDIRRALNGFDDDDRAFIEAAYDEELAYLDAQLGRFFDELESRGLWDDALVLLTADHGEELFEHGGFEHGHTLYDEVVRVPFIVWNGQAGRVREPVSLVDVLPTVMELVGVEVTGTLGGTSLAPFLDGHTAGIERGLVAEGLLGSRDLRSVLLWPHKVIFEAVEATEIYDLDADPTESFNRAAADPELGPIVAAASRLLESPSGSLRETEIDPEVLDQLRAIGYIR